MVECFAQHGDFIVHADAELVQPGLSPKIKNRTYQSADRHMPS